MKSDSDLLARLAELPDVPLGAHAVSTVRRRARAALAEEREGGRLADIAPTLLQLMGLPQPPEMTGQSLII